MPNNLPIAYSWTDAMTKAHSRGYGEKIEIPKTAETHLPMGFQRSKLSLPGKANAVYRDQRETDSFQIREFDDKWTLEIDQYNPEEGRAIEHAIADATGYTLVAGVAASLVIFSGS